MGTLGTAELDELILELQSGDDDPYWQALYQELLKTDLCLFAKDVLDLEIGPHLVDWGDLIQDHNRIAITAARDHSKSTFFSYAYPIWRAWSEPGCEVYVFSATLDGAMEFIDIIIYGRDNLRGMIDIPALKHLVPDGSASAKKRTRLNRTDARLTNGSRLRAVGYGKKIRGRHPKYIVCQPKGTPVLTPKGYTPIEKLKQGDLVWTHQGRWRPISGLDRRTARVRGYQLAGHFRYEWATSEHRFYKGGDQFEVPKEKQWVHAPLHNEVHDLPITKEQCAVLGTFLGNGTLMHAAKGVVIYASDRNREAIDALIRAAGYPVTWGSGPTCDRGYIGDRDLYKKCCACKVEGNSQKRIPFRYEKLPDEKLQALVYGYYVTDGCFSHAKGRTGEHKFTSVALPLLESVQRILARLGVTSSIRRLRPAGTMEIEGRTVNTQDTFDLRTNWELGLLVGHPYKPKRVRRNRRQYIEGGVLRRRVEQVVEDTEREVISFSVEEDHSYSGHLVCTHNCDDVLNDEDMWSETVRRKNIEYFKSAITNMLTPEGQLICVGCVTTDTWVPTVHGLQRIGTLRPGPLHHQHMHDLDLLVHGKNGMQRATKFWDNGLCATKRIELRDGHTLEASLKHPVWAKTGDGEGWVRISDLEVGQEVMIRIATACFGTDTLDAAEARKEGRNATQWVTIPERFMQLDKASTGAFLRGLYGQHNTAIFRNQRIARDVQTMMDNYGIPSFIFEDGDRYQLRRSGVPDGANDPWVFDSAQWSAVAHIENGHALTVDFVIPGDHSFVSNGIVSHNTPYHASDLWGFLRHNTQYIFKKYPGIIKDKETGEEKALFPWRWSLKRLHDKREEIGTVSFTREILCEPISDELSIFPSYLFPPLFDPILKLRPTRTEIKERGWSTYMGVDIARSASVGADFFVIFTIGVDKQGTRYIVDIDRTKGLPFNKQLEKIAANAAAYDPGLIFIESNAMQQVYTDEMRRMTDLPVKEFVTLATNKYPLDRGVPGIRILLENEKIVIPRGDNYSRKQTDIWIEEMSQFGYIDGKLQGIGSHDDTVMSAWFALEAAKAGGFSFAFGDEDADENEETEEGEDWESVMLGTEEERDGDSAFGT